MKVNFFKKLATLVAIILMVCMLPTQTLAEEYYVETSGSPVTGDVATGQWFTLTVSSNMSWTVQCTESWIHASKTSGRGNDSFTVSLSPHSGGTRTGVIMVEAENGAGSGYFIWQCGHGNTKREEVEDMCLYAIYETFHTVQKCYRIVCADCDKQLDVEFSDPVTEDHKYKNGKCVCSKEESKAECNHKYYTDNAYYAGKNKIEYSKITDTTHDAKHPYRRTCDDCGEVLKEGHFPAVTEKHTFKNGVCACGYEEDTECKHKYYTDEEYYGGKYQTEFSKITETTHDVKTPYRRTCDDCGEVLKEGHFPAVTEKHTFKNGVCACGYEVETDECTTHQFRGSKCQKCGFTAYISLSKDSVNVGESIRLSTNLPKGDYTFKVGKNLSLSGTKATAVAAGKGNVWLYYKGGSNSVASCVVEIGCDEHSFNAADNYEEVEYHDDGNTHTVITTIFSKCDCGYTEAIDIQPSIESHVDDDGDGDCDLCDGKYNKYAATDEYFAISSDPEEREKQYYDLLAEVKNGEDLDNRILQILQMDLQDESIPNEYIESILATVKSADSPYRELYLYTFNEYAVKYYENNIAKSGYFSATNNSLEMGAGDVVDTFLGGDFALTYFHEVGHAIDYNAEWASFSQEFAEALWNDATNVINDRISQVIANDSSLILKQDDVDHVVEAILGSDRTVVVSGPFYWNTVPENLTKDEAKVYAQVVTQLNKEIADSDVNNASMVVDILNALSNHTLHDWVINGHDMDYWYTEDGNIKVTVTGEAWAEFFAAKMTGFSEQDILNQEYFPDACEYMEQLTDTMLAYYKEQVKQH